MQLIYGFLFTLLATPALIGAAHRYGFLDYPDERKQHQGAIPAVGGLAMALAIAVCTVFHFAGNEIFWVMFAATFMIVLIGFLDDWMKLPIVIRFTAQGAAALGVSLFADVQLGQLGDLSGSGTIILGVSAIPLTVFAAVGVANAMNLSDGMDGLAGGLAAVAVEDDRLVLGQLVQALGNGAKRDVDRAGDGAIGVSVKSATMTIGR